MPRRVPTAITILALAAATIAGPAPTPQAQQAFERAREAEAAGRHREAFDAYLDAWHDPTLRHESARRARALERIARYNSKDDLSAVEPLEQRLGPGFATYRSTSFVVLSNADDLWTRSRITLLERAREQYFRDLDRLGVPVHPHAQRLVCVFFGEHGDYLDFARTHDNFDAGWTAGYYSMAHNAIIIHDDRTSPSLTRVMRELQDYQKRIDELNTRAEAADRQRQFAQGQLLRDAAADLEINVSKEHKRVEEQVLRFGIAKVLHEAIHLLAFNTGLQTRGAAYPLWVSEGLAASFEAHSTSGQFGFAFAYEPREQELDTLALQNQLPDFAKLLTLDDNTNLRADTARPIYAAAYGLFKELHRTERDRLAAYLAELADLPQGPQTEADHLARFERHFGDVATLERRIARRWIASAREREGAREQTIRAAGL
ncbi:MAG: DUF1570 domain-containing protein [Phycisphaerales bacterium JB064]